MALRNIRIEGDPILREKSKEVRKITSRTKQLIEDMVETMHDAEGVGLAAPQVGVLRRIVVIDIGDGPIRMINPVIIEKNGKELGPEGCLSVPGKAGTVERPEKVVVDFIDEEGTKKRLEANGFLARAVCHELDHLDGVLYIDKVVEYLQIEDN